MLVNSEHIISSLLEFASIEHATEIPRDQPAGLHQTAAEMHLDAQLYRHQPLLQQLKNNLNQGMKKVGVSAVSPSTGFSSAIP